MPTRGGVSVQTCLGCGLDNLGHEPYCVKCGTRLPEPHGQKPITWRRRVSRVILPVLPLACGFVIGSAPPLWVIAGIDENRQWNLQLDESLLAVAIVALAFALIVGLTLRFRLWPWWFLVSAIPAFLFWGWVLLLIASYESS